MSAETINGHAEPMQPAPPTRPPTQAEIEQAQAVLAAQQRAAHEAAVAQQLAASARREIPVADLSHLAPAHQAPVAAHVVQPVQDRVVPVGTHEGQRVIELPQRGGEPAAQQLVPVQPAAGAMTLGAWWDQRRRRPKTVWQRRSQRIGLGVAGAAFAGVIATAYMGRIADNRLDAAKEYIDGPVAEQTGAYVREVVAGEVAAQVQSAPKQLVSSDPLEKMLPCLLSGEARNIIGADPTLGNTTLNQGVTQVLAMDARAKMLQVLPQQLRIYVTPEGVPALSVDPTVGAALLDLSSCGQGG